jgi:ATP-binding cassette, subfamily C, bacterial
MLTAQGVLAVMLSAPLAALSFGLLAVSAAALVPVMRQSRQLGEYLTQASQDLLHGTAQFLGGLKIAVSQNLQRGFLTAFKETLRSQNRQQIAHVRRQTVTRLAVTTLSALIGAALVPIGLLMLHVPPALLTVLLLVVARMSGPAMQLQQGAQQVAGALPAYEAIVALRQELAAAPVDEAVTGDAPAIDGEICFAHVGFDHVGDGNGEPHGVEDVTLTIAPGTCLGIKGPSGSGKTTLVDLLSGLYPPQSGSITVGGRPLAGGLLNRWRDRIGYVTQDPFLFNDTIRRNLVWASPKAGENDIWQALELVEAAGFVRGLPDGLDTVVGERGTLVSGGERQRLALARGVLRRPQLLILDEATNAVDPATERTILDRLLRLSPKSTVVIVAHRPESLLPCDRVLTLSAGRLA